MPPGKKLPIRKEIVALEPAVAFLRLLLPAIQRNPEGWLDNGREVLDSKLRPREILGLIVLSVVISHRTKLEWKVGTDHDMGDGTIVLLEDGQKALGIPVEQVYVNTWNSEGKTLADAALAEFRKKEAKGEQYTTDRSLIALVNENGEMNIDKFCSGVASRTFKDIAIIGQLTPNKLEFYCGIVNQDGGTDDYRVKIDEKTGSSTIEVL